MKKYSTFIGVDISKNSLDICSFTLNNTDKITHQKIGNTPKEIKDYLKNIDAENGIFCMEDTGIYGMHLYRVLTEHSIDFSVVPAIDIKRSKGLARGKSDKSDAKDIAMFAYTHLHELQLYEMPEETFQELKLLIAERDKLVKAIKIFRSTEESSCYVAKATYKSLKKNNSKTTKLLKQQLEEIEGAIKTLIKDNEAMSYQMELLQSIPGIGFQTALQLMVYTKCFKSFKNWRQLACYAGIAPFPYQSGKSIKGKTKVSNLAQKKLKSSIHMASLTMKKYDTEIKQYFERKVNEGKNKMSVINAIRCKLIARAFAVINRGTPFVNTQKFAA
jgi:transposase